MPILFGRTGEKADGDRRGGNASQAAGLLENGGRMGRVGEDTVGGGRRRARGEDNTLRLLGSLSLVIEGWKRKGEDNEGGGALDAQICVRCGELVG